MVNATCLTAARDSVLGAAGWNARDDGLIGAPEVRVVVGAEAHSTVFKALGLIGLGRNQVTRLAVDEQGAVRAPGFGDLDELVGPTIVCLQAGNVNSGASDDFVPLIDWAHAPRRVGTRRWRFRPLGCRRSRSARAGGRCRGG